MRLFRLELKRILKSRRTLILLAIALLLSVAMAYLPISYEGINRPNDVRRTDFADIQNKKECGGNRQWQNHYLRNWAANTKGKGII